MKILRYGASTLRFGAGDKALIMEVTREQRQRPLQLLASWFPLPVPVTAGQLNGFARVIAYRGTIADELASGLVPTQNQEWRAALGFDLDVFLDAAVTYIGPGLIIDFREWPNALVKTQANQTLGAAILAPFDTNTGGVINGDVVLTFIGDDSPDDDESDVRKWKVK